MKEGRIIKVSGPLVVADKMEGAKMYDVVRVGIPRLIGEIIELRADHASIQVYEETTGIGPGEPVFLTDEPLCVELGPGLIGSIYDGIQRPLDILREKTGDYIVRGVEADALNRKKKWEFKSKAKKNEKIGQGDILGEVQETSVVTHRVLLPPGIEGVVEEISDGKFSVDDVIAKVRLKNGGRENITMVQRWPVRKDRPCKEKISPVVPLVTGQRVIDTFFPVTKGGVACIPGPFGSGKTVVLHEIAKWADADIIVYVGCGERGNEMTDVLIEFPKLCDPRTGKSLMERSILIANTSNMPVAAREASVYTGITLAEYYRDMGYDVALMADSTSRWAEALREISGRLEEMPGEEGYPAYLGMRVAQFYERAGRVVTLGKLQNPSNDGKTGSLSVVGAVSPPGGDLSDAVVQATLRVVKVFWSLEDKLAYKRHFPAINWLSSYSLYLDNIKDFLKTEIGEDFLELRNMAMKILQEEDKLLEIARLVGIESLSIENRLTLEIARSLREDFLHQNAFDPIDVHSSLLKQYKMLKLIINFYHDSLEKLKAGGALDEILTSPIRDKLRKSKFLSENEI
ncbi:V-type ATP synthase subunit A [Candidatus Desantisbacteria bacterium CG07_land_8_20_14_0_80_39_15]|uniref:V-type ATP synthase alpha chain n=2 Tax=unclassified Candidatus Desantisiibacteriota TaxID=3106372 RepID=A0A2H9PC05_9BACT|nr:MAG: V-type ATP synthase subunit A [Candidatus Desantisbacteria bacterium CG07_land_8_20_14_0_80_39_15]PIZ16577.1 MAG: V-type ATP synthase subunit A [Candidatus Desantisbacteria bacterium CG_4_10_14_0_8_um_filter_39_17]